MKEILDKIDFIPYLKNSYEDPSQCTIFEQRSRIDFLIEAIEEDYPNFYDVDDDGEEFGNYLLKRYPNYIREIEYIEEPNMFYIDYYYCIRWIKQDDWELGVEYIHKILKELNKEEK